MGILTDFFIATAEDMNALRVEQSVRDLFPTLEMKNVDSSKVEMLATLVISSRYEQKPDEKQPDFLVLVKGASEDRFISADEYNEEDPVLFDLWIERFDPAFVECLATFPDEEVFSVATQWAIRWAEFEGRPVGKNDTESLSALVQQLCQLAKRAYAEKKQMYLRTCL